MSLKDRIIAEITANGPMSVADYMARALLDLAEGYYTTRTAIGAQGDFVTAPEISQMFGELLGLCLAQTWLDQGAPDAFTLAELGPGRGTLMADALRATRGVPGFHEAAQVALVEASPVMRAAQADALADTSAKWHDSVATLPDRPLYLIANEFFDALPIRQFQRDGQRWRERHIGTQEGTLFFGLGLAQPQPALAHRLADTADGALVEMSPQLPPIMSTLATRIAEHGGAALIVDYGDWRSNGDTLQAVSGHKHADPLAAPGQADLTAHVDFEAIAQAAKPLAHTKLTTQGVFLERLGITARAQVLATSLTGAARDSHIAAHRRLTHPDEMGNLFRVMGLYPETATPPPGLDA